MKRSFYTLPAIVRSRGVGLVTAIFLLVVIAGLAVAMVTVYTTQQTSSALDLQGARAYQAARAGLEWGMFRKVRGDSCVGVSSFAFDNDTSLRGFVVTVTCEGAVKRWRRCARTLEGDRDGLQYPGQQCLLRIRSTASTMCSA